MGSSMGWRVMVERYTRLALRRRRQQEHWRLRVEQQQATELKFAVALMRNLALEGSSSPEGRTKAGGKGGENVASSVDAGDNNNNTNTNADSIGMLVIGRVWELLQRCAYEVRLKLKLIVNHASAAAATGGGGGCLR